jgi:parallel beta-helix repeat protein
VHHNYFNHRGGLGGLPPMGIWVDVCPTGTTVIEANFFSTKMTHAILFDQGAVEIRRNTIVGTVTDYADLNGPAVKIIDAEFAVEENLLLENQYAAINAVSSEGTITGNRIESSRPSDPGLKNGDGIIVKDCDPGPVFIKGNTLVRNTRNGILVTSSIVKVEGNYIADTELSPSANSLYGTGINVVDGSDATIFGNSIVGNRRLGIRFDNAYGWVDGNVIADTKADDDGGCGGGILVGGAKSSYLLNGISRNLFSGNYCAGLFVDNSNVGTVSKNVFVGTEGKKGSMGIGAIVVDSDCNLEENWFVDNEDSGALFQGSSGKITNNVFEINGTAGLGGGLVVQDSPHPEVEVSYNTFRGNGLAGAIVRASRVELRRNAFIENVGNSDGIGGAGAWFDPGSEGSARANYADGNLLAGILAYEVSELTVSVNYIANTAIGSLVADPSPVQLGEGIVAARQSFVSLLYNTVVSNKNSGIACFDSEGAIQGNTLLSNGKWGVEMSNSQMTIATNLYRNNGIGEQTSGGDRAGPPAPLDQWEPCTEE